MRNNIKKLTILALLTIFFVFPAHAQEKDLTENVNAAVVQAVETIQEVVAPTDEQKIQEFEARINDLKEKRRTFNEKRVAMPEVSQVKLLEDKSEMSVGLRALENLVNEMKNPNADIGKLSENAENLIKELEKNFIHSDGDYMEERRDYTRRIKINLKGIDLKIRKVKDASKTANNSIEKNEIKDLYRNLKEQKLEIEKLLTEIWQNKEPERSRSRIQSLMDDIMEKTNAYI